MVGAFRYFFIIAISFLVGLILTLWPLPDTLHWYRPEWILLLVIFWSLDSSKKVGIGIAWVIGLIIDVLSSGLLGEHALVFAIISYLALKTQPRFKLFPSMQQLFTVFIFILIAKILLYFIQTSIGQAPAFGIYFVNLMTTMLFWPLVSLLISYYLQKLKLYNSRGLR